ncbi:MAG: site-specific DNA-methyltransferase [Muribaculaceae bacterium]|nr:site-specific DNA-methyltransferase [Muribaculaceae bacterium]
MYFRTIDNYWNFRAADTKEYTHCYHNYPAMMIPQIARKLLADYAPEGKLELVLDPYAGSGTTLVESSIRGLRSVGIDLNPLARFMSRVKNTHYDSSEVNGASHYLQDAVMNYTPSEVVNTDFSRISNYSYWYREDYLYKLSYLNQIISELDLSVQDFFLLCLSETVREVSFTRNSEFKRYKMSEKQLEKFNPDVFCTFFSKVQRNSAGLEAFNKLGKKDLAAVYDFNTSKYIPAEILPDGSVDMVVTSPPYGDSHTTVAYGQFSRWANEWFDFENARNLDRILMGGTISNEKIFETVTVQKELDAIKAADEKRYHEVISFLNDYWNSIQNVARIVRKGGRVCYVVGNRRVKDIQINLDFFTAEMFEKCGFKHEITIMRDIPNKRMPSKNSPTNIAGEKASTMTSEYIVILTKVK